MLCQIYVLCLRAVKLNWPLKFRVHGTRKTPYATECDQGRNQCNHGWKKLRGPRFNTGAPRPTLGWVREEIALSRCGGPGYYPRKIFLNSDAKSCILVRSLVGSLGRAYPSKQQACQGLYINSKNFNFSAVVAPLVVRTKNATNQMEIMKRYLLWNFLFFENYCPEVGDQCIVGPQPKSWGTSLPRSLRLLWLKAKRPSVKATERQVGQVTWLFVAFRHCRISTSILKISPWQKGSQWSIL